MGLEVSKKFVYVMAAVTIVIGAILILIALKSHENPQAIRDGVELTELDSYWSLKAANPGEVTMVPTITFRIRNKRTAPLDYVKVNGIFTIVGENRALGDAFAYPIQGEPLQSNVASPQVRLKCNYGYSASSRQAFLNNPGFKPVEIKIFIESRSSGPVPMGTYRISRRIEGVPESFQTEPKAIKVK